MSCDVSKMSLDMSGWMSQSQLLVVKLSLDKKSGGIKWPFSCKELKMLVQCWKNILLLKITARKSKKVEKLLHKQIWVCATFLCHCGTNWKQNSNKRKVFSIKWSAHYRQSHTATEGPEFLPSMCAISVPGLSLNSLIKYLKKKKEQDLQYLITCTVLSKPVMFEWRNMCTSWEVKLSYFWTVTLKWLQRRTVHWTQKVGLWFHSQRWYLLLNHSTF